MMLNSDMNVREFIHYLIPSLISPLINLSINPIFN